MIPGRWLLAGRLKRVGVGEAVRAAGMTRRKRCRCDGGENPVELIGVVAVAFGRDRAWRVRARYHRRLPPGYRLNNQMEKSKRERED